MKKRLAYVALVLSVLSLDLVAAQRGPVAGRFALEIEGSDAGLVKSVGGGFAYGFVVEEPGSPDYFFKKHLEDPPGYKDITIECGTGMSAAFFQWITDVMNGQLGLRKSGAIVALDYNMNIVRRLQFADAQITRIAFPRLDASSNAPGTLRVTLTPASTAISSGGGKYSGSSASGQKGWQVSNFQLAIGGLDTTKVNAIEAIDIVVPWVAPPDQVCSLCEPVVPRISFPQLEIVGSESAAASWFAWHQSFVIGGLHDDANEKSGSLQFLDSSLKTLFSLQFTGLGVIAVENVPASASDTLSRVRATMYTEKMTFSKP